MIAVGLVNPKTPANFGAVLRAAHCFEAQMVVAQGQRLRIGKAPTDVTKEWNNIPVLQVDDLMEVIPYNAVPIAIELTENAKPLADFKHPKNAFYIFGPEDGSVPKHILERCAYVLYIPTKACLNLAATVNVVLYDRQTKQESK